MNDRERPGDDDLALSGLLDNALPDDQAAALRRRLTEEPELARRFEAMRRGNEAVRKTYAGIVDEPLPRAVTELLSARGITPPIEEPLPFRARRPRTRRFALPHALSAAAALAAGFILAFLILPRTAVQAPPGLLSQGGLVPEGSLLHEALDTTASSETSRLGDGWTATPRLTFVNVDGEPCRRVDLAGADSGLATLACRNEAGWQMELVAFDASIGSGSDGGFRPASGGSAERIDEAIDTLIDGGPLDRAAELALISRGWKTDGARRKSDERRP